MRPWALAILASAILLPACGETGPSPIGRGTITTALSSVEVLALERDVTATNPDSTLDAIYVPASNIVDPPFRVALFDDQDAAEARARALEETRGKPRDFVQYKNAILILRTGVADTKRAKLIAVLTSL